MHRNQSVNHPGGLSAGKLVLPLMLLLTLLHLLIIMLILNINTVSAQLSVINQESGSYTQDATSMLAGSSLLSETSTHFVLLPVMENGELNLSPLVAYARELAEDHRGDGVLARFKTYNVEEDVVERIAEAAASANYMLDAQLHAISLMRSVYPLPEVQPINAIPRVELTEAEQAMSDEQRVAAARALVLSTTYGLNKQSVSENVNAGVGMLQAQAGRRAGQASGRLKMMRQILWADTLFIIVIMMLTFALLYSKMLLPLERFVRLIPENRFLDEKRGFNEVRLVASAYNGVLKRRDALDAILRSAAETDALTNLPNRYRFEQYLLEVEESGYSAAVMLFDINYLKYTNDTQGHLAGDQLIRSAANCISSCFGENCFRFGGDEFAAIVRDCTPESLDQMVRQFENAEKQHNISVSLGYAYVADIGSTTYKQLLDEADRNMYAQKKEIHRQEPLYLA